MITDKEVQATLLSPTKKDFYQIWNELLETASKISDRWTPSETNESDPGIVLLKVLTACADKLNYNVDKNILEAFMPSAAQEESMRKLCDMMGYQMKYYTSATTDVTIYYNGDPATEFQSENVTTFAELTLPKFTNIQTIDGDINYVTLNQISFNKNLTTNTVNCIEGTLHYCEDDNNNKIVTINNIDDNNRYYFPVNNVAENGIFIYSVLDNSKSSDWEKVENLNTVALEKQCFKFGFDSKEMLPYVQFPDDISSIIGDGLVIAYIVTNGINGNVKAKTLNTFIPPTSWNNTNDSEENHTGLKHDASEFSCYNVSAATNGTDKESLNDAYKNFKRTVGTFDTLITCRDYMNKIYDLTMSAQNTTPLVSNAIVSDIRDDINKSITICSFNEFGINYLDEPITEEVDKIVYEKGDTTKTPITIVEKTPLIDSFDIILYPFKTIYGLNNKSEHDGSFKYDKTVYNKTVEYLKDSKTISHNIRLAKEDTSSYPQNNSDIVLIKNYLKLSAKMTATKKINDVEQTEIKNNIKKAIYEKFNLRQLDFGEEIPFDDILNTIQDADVRIKNIALDEPILYTRFVLADNSEYDTAVAWNENMDENGKAIIEYKPTGESLMKRMMSAEELIKYNNSINKDEYRRQREIKAKEIYNKLALRNIMAGKLNLFNYETEFTPSITESAFSEDGDITPIIFPRTDVDPEDPESKPIYYIEPSLTITNVPKTASDQRSGIEGSTDIKLKDNQIIQFRAPNFTSVVTYPAYVNYFIQLTNKEKTPATPATFKTLGDEIKGNKNKLLEIARRGGFNATTAFSYDPENPDTNKGKFIAIVAEYGGMFVSENGVWTRFVNTWPGDEETETGITNFVIYELNKDTYGKYYNYIKDTYKLSDDIRVDGLYKSLNFDDSRSIGKYVDADKVKYKLDTVGQTVASPLTYYYIPVLHYSDVDGSYTKDGLGKDAVYSGLSADSEYQLKSGEFLCINYTNAETSADTSAMAEGGEATITSESEIVNVYYGPGTIIRPNFEIIDSASRRESGKSYSKSSGYDFQKDLGSSWRSKVPGMYSLGANEQIEIRKIVNVPIYDNTENSKVFVYFMLKNETADSNGYVTFLKNGERRTLDEGEYFWYTDKNKTTLTYCGNGTEIINNTGVDIKKKDDAGWSTADNINNTGIEAIPWIALTNLRYDINNPESQLNRYIDWIEYQYITLICPDSLRCTSISGGEQIINSTWQPVNGKTTYILDGKEANLPEIILNDESAKTWEVRAKLSINTNGSNGQLLHNTEYTTTEDGPACEETISLLDETGEITIATLNKDGMTIKTNYPIDETSDKIQTTFKAKDENGNEYNVIDDFKVKTIKNNEITIKENLDQPETITINNMSTYFTSFTFEDGVQDEKFSTIHCAIPDATKQYGILMLYYVSNETTINNSVFIKLKGANDSSIEPIIFNNYDTDENMSWWTDRIVSGKYYLKPNALNVIKITNSASIEIYSGKNVEDALIISPLRLINFKSEIVEGQTVSDEGINLDLIQYFNTSSYSQNDQDRAKQLLADINKIDPEHKFFYNAVIDGSTALDINILANENLATPRIWYSYNNINNKFVVSEIDTNYIDDGITFASSSIKYE